MTRTRSRTLAACILLLAAAGCSGSSKTSATATTSPSTAVATQPNPGDYGARYLALGAPVNAAYATFQSAIRNRGTNKGVPAGVVSDLIRAISTFDTEAKKVQWPGASTQADLQNLVRVHAALIADLKQVNNQAVVNDATYANRLTKNLQALSTAAAAMRTDLGLSSPQP